MKKVKPAKGFPKELAKQPQSPEVKRLEGVFQLMNSYGVGELELEDKAGRIHVRMQGSESVVSYAPAVTRTQAPSAPVPMMSSGLASTVLKDTAPAAAKAELPSNQKKMLSPFVGTFYRSSNPNAAPYVKEGQSVRKGQTLCIIEAMKLMNEIESDFEGKIVSALVENGQPVEFGEPLFIIEV